MSEAEKGKVALITGAGNGIGRAAALQMAAAGITVGVNDLKEDLVHRTVADIEAAGGKAVPLVINVGTRDGVRQAVADLVAKTGRLDIMVNNAAWVRYQHIADIQPETLDRMVEVGFKSVIWGIQAAAEVMDRERGGSIVNVASAAAVRSTPTNTVYSGIKAGILGVTRASAADLGRFNIRVNAVAPSSVPTEGTAKHRTEEKDAIRAQRTPLGRLGTAEEVAQVICFLAGSQSGFVSGEVIMVDGGITITSI